MDFITNTTEALATADDIDVRTKVSHSGHTKDNEIYSDAYKYDGGSGDKDDQIDDVNDRMSVIK